MNEEHNEGYWEAGRTCSTGKGNKEVGRGREGRGKKTVKGTKMKQSFCKWGEKKELKGGQNRNERIKIKPGMIAHACNPKHIISGS